MSFLEAAALRGPVELYATWSGEERPPPPIASELGADAILGSWAPIEERARYRFTPSSP